MNDIWSTQNINAVNVTVKNPKLLLVCKSIGAAVHALCVPLQQAQAWGIFGTLFEGRFTPIACVDEEEWLRCKAKATHLCLTALLTQISCNQFMPHCHVNAILEERGCVVYRLRGMHAHLPWDIAACKQPTCQPGIVWQWCIVLCSQIEDGFYVCAAQASLFGESWAALHTHVACWLSLHSRYCCYQDQVNCDTVTNFTATHQYYYCHSYA